MFVAVILDNLELDEDIKKLKQVRLYDADISVLNINLYFYLNNVLHLLKKRDEFPMYHVSKSTSVQDHLF